MNEPQSLRPVLILAGGVALGAYQAGAFEHLAQRGVTPVWVAGSSIGGVNAALIAGNAPADRVDRLEAFWQGQPFTAAMPIPGPWRHAANWASAIGFRLAGAVGQFHPRVPNPFSPFRSFYDLEPMRQRLLALVDFDRLGRSGVRLTIAATDLATGELVLFDTGRGDRITVDHILASCGFLPEFAPVQIDGRWLGDGGLCANAPIEALRLEPDAAPSTVFVLDLFARDGAPPASLEDALLRKNDLTFSNQTWQRLEAHCRETRLTHQLSKQASEGAPLQRVFYLSYRPEPADAILDKMYDYSARTIAARWHAGAGDMEEALAQACNSVPSGGGPIAVRRKLAA